MSEEPNDITQSVASIMGLEDETESRQQVFETVRVHGVRLRAPTHNTTDVVEMALGMSKRANICQMGRQKVR